MGKWWALSDELRSSLMVDLNAGLIDKVYSEVGRIMGEKRAGWIQTVGEMKTLIPSYDSDKLFDAWKNPFWSRYSERHIQEMNDNDILSENYMMKTPFSLNSKYRYVLRPYYLDEDGEQVPLGYQTMYSDNLYSKESIIEAGKEYFGKPEFNYSEVPVNFDIIRIDKNSTWDE